VATDGIVTDTFSSIENAIGTQFADRIVAGADANRLEGRGGNDTFVFQRGQANGDTVTDFAGNGAGAGDILQFVGYGPGAAAGAAIACRDQGRFCVSLMGDGDFVMSAGAIWSAVHNRAPMLIVINNNTTWGNDEKHQIEVAHERRRPVENAWIGQRMVDPDIDHATVARGYGAWAKGPIFDPAELAGVFKEAVAEVERGRVAVVEVRTQLV